MSFLSIQFVAFIFIVFFLLCHFKKTKQQRWLLLANCIFYGFSNWRFLALLFFIIFVVYEAALYVHKTTTALYLGILLPLSALGIFKYLNFFRNSFDMLLNLGQHENLAIVLPLGISFYTFLAVSYLLDVSHNKMEPESSFIKVALYISFFPTVISGPIMKARDLVCQFHKNIDINSADMKAGMQIFLMGCLKKYVVADRLGIFVGDVYHSPLAFDSATVWLAVISYSLQLYLDFAGYSDMAIGCARCLGFHLCDNFNMPYIARNISEFWKRWHISLSSWLQEYLYFSLGGSRCGAIRSYSNLMVTMLICGLWHGAA